MKDLENKSNNELCFLIQYSNNKQQAWEQLLKQNPSNDVLCYIIKHTNYKEEAFSQLKTIISKEDFRYIIGFLVFDLRVGDLFRRRAKNKKMREIKFRGKRIDNVPNNKWVFGYLFYFKKKDRAFIMSYEEKHWRKYEVDPSTVEYHDAHETN